MKIQIQKLVLYMRIALKLYLHFNSMKKESLKKYSSIQSKYLQRYVVKILYINNYTMSDYQVVIMLYVLYMLYVSSCYTNFHKNIFLNYLQTSYISQLKKVGLNLKLLYIIDCLNFTWSIFIKQLN